MHYLEVLQQPTSFDDVWTFYFVCAAVLPQALLLSDMVRLVGLVSYWTEKPCTVSPGPWEVGRVAQLQGLSHESGLSRVMPRGISEIRTTGTKSQGLWLTVQVTSCRRLGVNLSGLAVFQRGDLLSPARA